MYDIHFAPDKIALITAVLGVSATLWAVILHHTEGGMPHDIAHAFFPKRFAVWIGGYVDNVPVWMAWMATSIILTAFMLLLSYASSMTIGFPTVFQSPVALLMLLTLWMIVGYRRVVKTNLWHFTIKRLAYLLFVEMMAGLMAINLPKSAGLHWLILPDNQDRYFWWVVLGIGMLWVPWLGARLFAKRHNALHSMVGGLKTTAIVTLLVALLAYTVPITKVSGTSSLIIGLACAGFTLFRLLQPLKEGGANLGHRRLVYTRIQKPYVGHVPLARLVPKWLLWVGLWMGMHSLFGWWPLLWLGVPSAMLILWFLAWGGMFVVLIRSRLSQPPLVMR